MKFLVAIVCFAAVASAHHDGQWRGEGLAESQDWGQWDHGHGHHLYAGAAPLAYGHHGVYAHAAPLAYAHHYAHGAAPIGHDGRVVDTPEVAHAKAAHFAAKAAAAHGHHHDAHAHALAVVPAAHYAHAAPLAYAHHYAHGGAPIGHDGRVVDTPEVAHAKAAHFAAHNAAAAHGHVAPVYAAHYAGALHYAHGGAPIGHDGRVVDTPEVAHAKAAHFAAHNAAAAHGHHYGHHW